MVYRGVNDDGDFVDGRAREPAHLVAVWVGFALLMVGCLIAAVRQARPSAVAAARPWAMCPLPSWRRPSRTSAERPRAYVAPRKSVVEETAAEEVALVEDAEGDAAADADAAAEAEARSHGRRSARTPAKAGE